MAPLQRLVLLATISILACGCASEKTAGLGLKGPEKTRKTIRKVVEDPERRDSMLAIVDSFESEVAAIEASIAGIRDEIVEANRNYATARSELRMLYGAIGIYTRRLGETTRDHSLELKALSTREEWGRITHHESGSFQIAY